MVLGYLFEMQIPSAWCRKHRLALAIFESRAI